MVARAASSSTTSTTGLEGLVGAGDKIALVEPALDGMAVREVLNLLYFDEGNKEDALRASRLEALTPRWREIFAERVG